MYKICSAVKDSRREVFPVRKMIAKRIREPKNILEKVTTNGDSLLIIADFAIVFSVAQRAVADRTRMSPILISRGRVVACMTISPRSIIPTAVSCCLVIFSFRKMKARMHA